MEGLKREKIDRFEIVLIFLLLTVLALNVVILRKVSLRIFDADTSADMLLSYALSKQGGLYTEDFFYATEPQIILPVFFTPFFRIFDGWNMVRFCGSLCMEAVYLFSFIFMLIQYRVRRKTLWMSCILLMLPMNVAYGRSILFHCFYTIQAALSFLSLGFLFMLIRRVEKKSRRSSYVLPNVGLFVCMALGCLKGVRVFVSTAVPVAVITLIWLFRRAEREPISYPSELYPKWISAVFVLVFGGVLGMVFSKLVLLPRFGSLNLLDQKLTMPSPEKVKNIFQGVFCQLGLRINVPLTGMAGILAVLGVAVGFWLIFRSFFTIWDGYETDPKKFLLYGMFSVQLLITALIFFLTDTPFETGPDYSRYFVLASLWMVPVACLETEVKTPWWKPKKGAAFFCVVILFLNGIYNGAYYLFPDRFPQEYDGLSYRDIALGEKLQSVKNYIQVHEYTLGYALPDEANPLCEMMNGFPMIPLTMEPERLYYDDWNTLRSIRDLNAEKSFLVLPKEKKETFEAMEIAEPAELLYFDDEGFLLYEFSDGELFREYLRSQKDTYQKHQ